LGMVLRTTPGGVASEGARPVRPRASTAERGPPRRRARGGAPRRGRSGHGAGARGPRRLVGGEPGSAAAVAGGDRRRRGWASAGAQRLPGAVLLRARDVVLRPPLRAERLALVGDRRAAGVDGRRGPRGGGALTRVRRVGRVGRVGRVRRVRRVAAARPGELPGAAGGRDVALGPPPPAVLLALVGHGRPAGVDGGPGPRGRRALTRAGRGR